VDVKPIPGLEQLPFAEVWFLEIDDERWREASAAARAIDKTGLEVWTTDKTPDVVSFLEERGYEQVRRYVISELDVASTPDPAPPGMTIATFADRLRRRGVNATIRRNRGVDIDAACGQLRARVTIPPDPPGSTTMGA